MARSKSKALATCTVVQMVACFVLIGQFLAVVLLTIIYQESSSIGMALPFSFVLCFAAFRGLVPNKELCLLEAIEHAILLWKK